jgi:hypothetical protein
LKSLLDASFPKIVLFWCILITFLEHRLF